MQTFMHKTNFCCFTNCSKARISKTLDRRWQCGKNTCSYKIAANHGHANQLWLWSQSIWYETCKHATSHV